MSLLKLAGQACIFIRPYKIAVKSICLFSLLATALLLVSGCAETLSRAKLPPKEPSTAYLKKVHPQVILVLGSGSARGFAHAGVLKTLEENHIPIDMIVGTSAGSIVGALYADNPSAESLEHLLLTTPRKEVIDFSLMNLAQGPISGNGLQNFLITNLHATSFEQLQVPFVAVATDLDRGEIHAFGSGPIAPAVNASSAAPPFFRPVKMYGKTFIDGGILDPVAVDVARRFHPKIIIAVSLNYTLSKEMPTNSPSVFLRGFDMMLLKLNDYSSANAQVIIHPETDSIDMFDDPQRAHLIYSGELAAEKALPAIKKLLAKYHIALTKDRT